MRELAAGADALLSAAAVRLQVAVKMELTADLRVCTGTQPLVIDGEEYLASGMFGSIEVLDEQAGQAAQLRFTLAGVTIEQIALVLAEPVRRRPCTVRLALQNADSGQLIDAPVMWAGELATMTYSRRPDGSGGFTPPVSVTAKSRSETFGISKPLRYTDDDQRRRIDATDTSLRHIATQSQHSDVWPAASYFRR